MHAQVSVIMPVYNKGKYIQRAIESVLSQKDVEVELICIDDGSSDNSVEIIESNRTKAGKLKLIRQANAGAGVARNAGIEQASGEYLAFLDPDDWYPNNNVLSNLYACARKSGCTISMGKRLYYVRPFTFKRKDNVFSEGVHDLTELTSAFLYQSCIFGRRLVTDNEIEFPPYRRFQDPPFFLKALSVANSFYFADNYVHCYRRGVQRIAWNDEKLMDYISGVQDSLRLAESIDNNSVFHQVLSSLNHASFTEGVLDTASESVVSALQQIERHAKRVLDDKHFSVRALKIMRSDKHIQKKMSIWTLRLENGVKSAF